AQPQLAVGVDVGSVLIEFPAVLRLRGDQVESGQQVDGVSQRLRHLRHLPGEPAENSANLTLFFSLDHDSLGTQRRNGGWLDEDGLARAGSTVNDPGDLVSMIDGDGEDVVIAVDRGVGIAKNFSKGGVAEKTADDLLNSVVDARQFLPYR